jgi:hypothetical protein
MEPFSNHCFDFINISTLLYKIARLMSTRTPLDNRSSNFFPIHQQFKKIQSSSFDKNKQFVSNCYTLQHCDSCTNVFIVKNFLFFDENKKI